MDYDTIYEKFVGSGKIQPLNVYESENKGAWILRYKDGKKNEEIECEDRDALDRILVEFGGKNPDTCKTFDKFLKIDGSWLSEDLNILGHRINKIKIGGFRVLRSKTIPLELPNDCGSLKMFGARRGPKKNSVNLLLTDRETVDFTVSFVDPEHFDNMVDFILKHDSLKDLTWHVGILGTESRETKAQCLWERIRAGDGTRRMVLELHALNGNDYTECVRQDLFNAAGDMFHTPCKRIPMKKKGSIHKLICAFAAEDGTIDISDYENI
jgi:hypothetical protein